MKERLRRCLEIYLIAGWSETILRRKEKAQGAMNDMPYWTKSACEWDPIECSSANFHMAFRLAGRPYVRCYSTTDVPLPTLIPYAAPNRSRSNVLQVPFLLPSRDTWW